MKKGPQTSFSRHGNPGQRQQERLQRRERRRRRIRVWLSIFTALVLLVFAGIGFWQLQRFNADRQAVANQQATATINTQNNNATATTNVNNTNATATADAQSAQITATAQVLGGTPTPVIPKPTQAADSAPAVNGEVITLPNGLQYIDIQEGVGMPAQSVYHTSVYYVGWIKDGKKFDSSFDNGGEPFSPSLEQGGVIPGWVEGVKGMKVGGVRRLIIPPDLAYGEQGAGEGVIPPNATLIFDITLVSLHP